MRTCGIEGPLFRFDGNDFAKDFKSEGLLFLNLFMDFSPDFLQSLQFLWPLNIN